MRVTSSHSARFKRKENKLNYKEDQKPGSRIPNSGEPEYIHVKFSDRKCGNKLARLNYCLWRVVFASVWFYFIPFSSIYLSYCIPFRFNEDVQMHIEDKAPPVVQELPENTGQS